MTLDDTILLAVFSRVVQAGSFTAAARSLGISISVVSERVSALEARLGVKLLHRSTRRMSLTTEGSEVYERCARMMVAADDAMALAMVVGDEPRGTLRVTAPTLFGQLYLPAPTAAFMRAWPSVRVELRLTDQPVDVVAERFDIAIRVTTQPPGGDLRVQPLARDERVLCASPAYLAKRGTPSAPMELAHHLCLRFAPLDVRSEWTLKTPQGPVLPPVDSTLLVNDALVLREAVLEGQGLAMLAGFLSFMQLAEGRLVRVMPELSTVPLGVYALYAAARRTPAKVRVFLELLTRQLRECPWNLEGRKA